ncbi:MAG: DUF4143 domain-containing protein [Bacteroidales bacterium]|nr:DUF4143 domain-containing protein [Bacteroidales bacterium]MCI2122329.1 DUF4143 domain-containing protein [Bacteroidales bacterium]MCI2145744.1 DUF4143 domain-containing protein [Bacteroidales bacterium]
MTSKEYLPRICDKLLAESLKAAGAVLIEGAKWCGKTSTASQAAKSALYMQDPDNAPSYMHLADTKPSLLLKGDNPRLLDEWQMAPVLWDAVRFEVDKRSDKGQFILTGSAVPTDNSTAHTGTGRFSRLLMRPMTLYESNESNGSVSLHDIFDGKLDIEGESQLTIEQIAQAICRGGWPAAIGLEEKQALKIARDYVDSIINFDVSRVDGIDKDPERVRLLLRSLARNESTLATIETIRKDIKATDFDISDKTIAHYMNALRRIFVIEDQPAWTPSMRSKRAIRASAKHHFVDPSIAVAVLGTNPEGILKDFESFGFFFESLCTRDLRVYAQANDGLVYHYHDRYDLESDIIIQLRDGRWGAVEVKLGNREIENAAGHLKKLEELIDTDKTYHPSFLMILTGGQFAYRRKDGVLIVPIGCMKP